MTESPITACGTESIRLEKPSADAETIEAFAKSGATGDGDVAGSPSDTIVESGAVADTRGGTVAVGADSEALLSLASWDWDARFVEDTGPP